MYHNISCGLLYNLLWWKVTKHHKDGKPCISIIGRNDFFHKVVLSKSYFPLTKHCMLICKGRSTNLKTEPQNMEKIKDALSVFTLSWTFHFFEIQGYIATKYNIPQFILNSESDPIDIDFFQNQQVTRSLLSSTSLFNTNNNIELAIMHRQWSSYLHSWNDRGSLGYTIICQPCLYSWKLKPWKLPPTDHLRFL